MQLESLLEMEALGNKIALLGKGEQKGSDLGTESRSLPEIPSMPCSTNFQCQVSTAHGWAREPGGTEDLTG